MATIKTTHVGSLPRTQDVVDFIFARDNNDPYDPAEFDACMAKNVDNTVKRQIETGIDIVSDGELSKIDYVTFIKERYSGFSGNAERTTPVDIEMFPTLKESLAQGNKVPKSPRPKCTGEIIKNGDNQDVEKDIDHFKTALKTYNHNPANAFLTAPSPGIITYWMPNHYYASHDEYMSTLADIMQAEYELIVGAGFLLQIDCPDLGLSRHRQYPHLSDDEFIKVATQNTEILNHALRNIPAEKMRMHICWGNYAGPHCCDIGLDKVFDVAMACKPSGFLFESSNPRHAHEWEVFKDNKDKIPHDKILIPGVIDSTSNFIEHPRLVKQRIEQFTNIVGMERVQASSDCGFSTIAASSLVDGDVAYAKLQSLVEGAALVK